MGSDGGEIVLFRLLLLLLLALLCAFILDFLSELGLLLRTLFLSHPLEESLTILEFLDLGIDFLGRSGGEQFD
jgi:hypothetical protein